jgi:hypothetical protein
VNSLPPERVEALKELTLRSFRLRIFSPFKASVLKKTYPQSDVNNLSKTRA